MVNEIDVTALAVEGSVTKRLNNVGQASARFNMKDMVPVLGEPIAPGMLMKMYFDTGAGDVLYHHGRILNTEVTADVDTGYVVVNSADPLELWRWRPVRDPGCFDDTGFQTDCLVSAPCTSEAGDFSKPQIITDFVTGPNIVQAMMFASQNISLGSDDAEGPLYLAYGTFECDGADLSGAPKDWPMTMMEMASLLTSTGELDVVCQPIELDMNGNYGELSAYNGHFGTDLTSSVTFSYGMGAYNIRSLRWNVDMANITNKLWYFLGPKCDDQHWPNNITARSDFNPCVCCDPDCMVTCNSIRDAIIACQGVEAGDEGDSRGDFGVRMDIKIMDGVGNNDPAEGGDCVEGSTPLADLCLWKNQWLREAFLRCLPRTLVHFTPQRDTGIGTFDIGDLITVEAHTDVNGGFPPTGGPAVGQRVYGYSIAWDAEDSVPSLGEIQTSSDQENFA